MGLEVNSFLDLLSLIVTVTLSKTCICMFNLLLIYIHLYNLKNLSFELLDLWRMIRLIIQKNVPFLGGGSLIYVMLQFLSEIANIILESLTAWSLSAFICHKFPLWVKVPQMAILRTCPNMTLAVEWDVKPQLCLWLYLPHRIEQCYSENLNNTNI